MNPNLQNPPHRPPCVSASSAHGAWEYLMAKKRICNNTIYDEFYQKQVQSALRDVV